VFVTRYSAHLCDLKVNNCTIRDNQWGKLWTEYQVEIKMINSGCDGSVNYVVMTSERPSCITLYKPEDIRALRLEYDTVLYRDHVFECMAPVDEPCTWDYGVFKHSIESPLVGVGGGAGVGVILFLVLMGLHVNERRKLRSRLQREYELRSRNTIVKCTAMP
jgi:hypothetical protein